MAESLRTLKTSTMTNQGCGHAIDPIPGSSSAPKKDMMIVQVEGGVPIVSGPTNTNLRSFYVSNPFATSKPKGGPRLGKNFRDPKYNPRDPTGSKRISKTAKKSASESVINGVLDHSASYNCDKKQSSKDCEPPVPCSSSNHNHAHDILNANRSKSEVVISSCSASAVSAISSFTTKNLNPPNTSLVRQTNRAISESTVILRNPTPGFKLVTYPDSSDDEHETEVSKPPNPEPPAPETSIPRNKYPPKVPLSELPGFEDLLTLAEKYRDKKLSEPEQMPIPTTAIAAKMIRPRLRPRAQHVSKSSIAQEFNKMVKELAAQDRQDMQEVQEEEYTRIEEPKTIPMFDYFESIYGLAFIRSPSPPDGGAVNEVKSKQDLGPLHVYNDLEEFSLPHERPPATQFEQSQLDNGITITVESVESYEQFIVGDHAGSSRLMRLETEMNTFYGKYLMRKRADNRELVFDIEEGGYYAVFLERHRIWARCYVTSVEAPRRGYYSHKGVKDPEQIINVILFDYGVDICNFKRKHFLPLKRFFLHLAIQKMDAQISWQKDISFPTDTLDIDHFRHTATGQQFHARILQYKPETEPLPTVWLELSDPLYDD